MLLKGDGMITIPVPPLNTVHPSALNHISLHYEEQQKQHLDRSQPHIQPDQREVRAAVPGSTRGTTEGSNPRRVDPVDHRCFKYLATSCN